jgi:hypothetical protein
MNFPIGISKGDGPSLAAVLPLFVRLVTELAFVTAREIHVDLVLVENAKFFVLDTDTVADSFKNAVTSCFFVLCLYNGGIDGILETFVVGYVPGNSEVLV